jgi:hypothetical protein
MKTTEISSQQAWIDHLKDFIEFTKKEIRATKPGRRLDEYKRSLSILRQQLREATRGQA